MQTSVGRGGEEVGELFHSFSSIAWWLGYLFWEWELKFNVLTYLLAKLPNPQTINKQRGPSTSPVEASPNLNIISLHIQLHIVLKYLQGVV